VSKGIPVNGAFKKKCLKKNTLLV